MPLPDYSIVDRKGPDHAPEFTVSVSVKGKLATEGTGSSKRAAEQMAASRLMATVTE